MLKIYLSTIKYYLQDEDQSVYLSTNTGYIIRDESEAVDKTREWSAYTKEARSAYNHTCEWKQTKKGMKTTYWTWDGPVCAKEWREPSAKLVARITYKETSCSMRELMNLNAADVIAYLKQEGIGLSVNP